MIIIKYGYDSVVIVEETHGTMDHQYRAKLRDGGGLGSGNTPFEAVMSLVSNMRREANDIEHAALKQKNLW